MNGHLWLIIILILNAGISYWNAYVCGKAWVESKALGGFIRVLVWCGAIQSALGFSSVILFPLAFIARAVVPQYYTDVYFEGTLSLWYITIIFPALGTGFIITIESWISAYRERSLLQMGRAAWNTYAQVHNTMGAINSLGPAFKAVGEAFGSVLNQPSRGKDGAKGKVAVIGLMIMVLLVLVALLGGALLTAVIIQRYAGTLPLPEEMDTAGLSKRGA